MNTKDRNRIIIAAVAVAVLGTGAIFADRITKTLPKKTEEMYYVSPSGDTERGNGRPLEDSKDVSDEVIVDVDDNVVIKPVDVATLPDIRENVAKEWFLLRDTNDVVDLEPFYSSLVEAMKAEDYPQILQKFDYVPLDESATGFHSKYLETANGEVIMLVIVTLPVQYEDRFLLVAKKGQEVEIVGRTNILFDEQYIVGDLALLKGYYPDSSEYVEYLSAMDVDTLAIRDLTEYLPTIPEVTVKADRGHLLFSPKDDENVPVFVLENSDDPEYPESFYLYIQNESVDRELIYVPRWENNRLNFERVEE